MRPPPEEASAANDAAIDLLHLGRPAEAAARFRHAIFLQPTGHAAATAYFNLGIALKDLSRHHDASVAYLSALQLRPAFPQAHFNLGRSFQMMADDPSAAGYLHRHAGRREILLRAAHHFRRSMGPESAGPADSFRSLEVCLLIASYRLLPDTSSAPCAGIVLLALPLSSLVCLPTT